MLKFRSGLLITLVFTLLFFGDACSSLNQAQEDDIIFSSREECLDVANCTSITASDLMAIEGNGLHSLSFGCPDETPNLHNMDVDQDRNVSVMVLGYFDDAVHVLFRNVDPEKSGRYQVFLGCSTEIFTQGEQFSGRQLGPPNDLPDVASATPLPGDPPPDACDSDIPDCVNVTSRRHKIGHLRHEDSRLTCPDTHPWYALAWVHSHISGWVWIVENPFSATRFKGDGDDFIVFNASPTHDHHWQVAIACSSNCNFAPGGCPDPHCKTGCRNDPGCRTIVPRTTHCAGRSGNCWSTWEESCPNGETWFCDTASFWTCCESC